MIYNILRKYVIHVLNPILHFLHYFRALFAFYIKLLIYKDIKCKKQWNIFIIYIPSDFTKHINTSSVVSQYHIYRMYTRHL